MTAEYKRDLNHNYLILHGESQVDTSSYQVRMLIANSIPCLLTCRLQGFDGEPLFYYDITSRQAVSAFYEKQKLKAEDLEMLFGGVVSAIHQMASFLLNPDQLLLLPEYLYMDVEKRELFLCCLPGYNREIRQQFRELTEYFLPKLDHQDALAVAVGYGIYRKAMEDDFQMEQVMEELYGSSQEKEEIDLRRGIRSFSREEQERKAEEKISFPGTPEKEFPGEEKAQALTWEQVEKQEKEKKKREKGEEDSKGKNRHSLEQKELAFGMLAGAILLTAAAAARWLGYLPGLKGQVLAGGMLVLGALGIFTGITWKRWEKKEKEPVLPAKQREGKESMEAGQEPVRNYASQEASAGEAAAWREEEILVPQVVGETEELCGNPVRGAASLVSKEPGELALIYLEEELTVIGKLPVAADVVIPLPTVSRIHAKIRRCGEEYYLTDLNSKNGTSVNGRMLKGEEEYCLCDQDEVSFGEARYIFLK